MILLPRGVFPPMLTPFTAALAIDWGALDRLTDWYLQAGVAGLFPVSLSSEMYDLNDEEKLTIVERVTRRVNGRIPVAAAGTFAGTIAEQAAFIRRIHDAGADCVIVIAAQMAQPDDDAAAWQSNVAALLDRTGTIPLGLYECPQPYKRALTPDLARWAAATGRFRFLKETTMQIDQLSAKAEAARDTPLAVYNAHLPTLLDSLRTGVNGYCGIAANYFPQLLVWLCAHSADDPERAERLQDDLNVLHLTVRNQYPANAKHFLAMQIDFPTYCRRMKPSISDSDLRVLRSLMKNISKQEDYYKT